MSLVTFSTRVFSGNLKRQTGGGIMAPFRWPEMKHELALAKEVAKYFPEKPQEWDKSSQNTQQSFLFR